MERIKYGKIFLALVVSCFVLIGEVAGRRSLTNLEIKRQLKRLNKPAVKSIKSEDGDIIDCVDIYKQPAFDHPLLKNHSIQMRPTDCDGKKKSSSKLVKQTWQKSGSCPEGTIPILRTQKRDLLKMVSFEEYQNGIGSEMESAKLYVEGENHGGEAEINVWNAYVVPGESSTASIFVGKHGLPDMINAGWIISSAVTGDNITRLYVFWKSDNGGCYNLKCSGFIQTNPNTSLGAGLYPLSTYGGDQYAMHVRIHKDYGSDNWWFEHNWEPVGYWPGSLFRNMATSANLIQWGGQVWNTSPGGRHTSTEMGSGHFAKEGFKKAAFFDKCIYFDAQSHMSEPLKFPTRATKSGCYDISRAGKDTDPPGVGFFYGGPGGPGCDGTSV